MPSRAQRVDQRPQLLAHLRVEADGRLVEQHEPRPVHERAGDQQPPPHAAGELVDPRVAAVDEVRDLERALDRRRALGRGDAVEVREDEQVLLDGQRRRRGCRAGARRRICARACFDSLGQPEAEHLELALVGDRLRREQPHRRRLAGAVRPEQADARALGHLEVEAVDGGDRAVALDDAAQPDRERPIHPAGDASDVPAAARRRARRPPSSAARAGARGRRSPSSRSGR